MLYVLMDLTYSFKGKSVIISDIRKKQRHFITITTSSYYILSFYYRLDYKLGSLQMRLYLNHSSFLSCRCHYLHFIVKKLWFREARSSAQRYILSLGRTRTLSDSSLTLKHAIFPLCHAPFLDLALEIIYNKSCRHV